MTTFEETVRPLVTSIIEKLRFVTSLDIEKDLVQTEQLGARRDFSKQRDMFVRIQSYSEELARLPWEDSGPTDLQSVDGRLNNLNSRLTSVMEFSSRDGSASERDSLAQSLASEFDQLQSGSASIVSYLSFRSLDIEALTQRTEGIVQDTQERANALLESLEGARDEVDRILRDVREHAAEQGVTEEAEQFNRSAEQYDKAATRWLRASIGFAVVTAIVAVGSLFVLVPEGSFGDAKVVQTLATKVTLFGIMTYATVSSLRLYRSNQHLVVINRHRKDALLTFRKFVDGTPDQEVKDKILLAAAHAAFGQTETGMITSRSGGGTLEVLEGMWGSLIRRPQSE